jgi:hypothetical protein
MREFQDSGNLQQQFRSFKRAAAKGHEESIWFGILSVVQDVPMGKSALKEVFAKTEETLGWYMAGRLSYWDSRERFDFMKKSAEGGCSWGQTVYGQYFYGRNRFVEPNEKAYVDWLEKAANQNNPKAMHLLGSWYGDKRGEKDKAVSYDLAASEMGWKAAMFSLAMSLKNGIGCEKDLRQAAIWSAKGVSLFFFELLEESSFRRGKMEDLDYDFNQLCYGLGWGLYWYQYGSEEWKSQDFGVRSFGKHCLDYYCSCVELQQESIFTFLLCWNRTTGRVKEPGQMIARIVWEGKETNLLLRFGEKRENRGCVLF